MPASGIKPMLEALGNTRRLEVLGCICRSPGGDAGKVSGEVGLSRPALTAHVRVLREAGLIAERREWRTVRYEPVPEAIDELASFFTEMAGTARMGVADAANEKQQP